MNGNRDVNEITASVINGDTLAYLELRTIYLDWSGGNFLFWSMFMANKYDYTPAYLDVYYALTTVSVYADITDNFDKIDPKTQKIALEYLYVAASRNESSAINELDLLKKHNKIK